MDTTINLNSIADLYVSAMNIMWSNHYNFSVEGISIVSMKSSSKYKEYECDIRAYEHMQQTLDDIFKEFKQRNDVTKFELYTVHNIIKQINGDICKIVFDYCKRYNKEGNGQVLTYDGNTAYSRECLDDYSIPEVSGTPGHVLEYLLYHFPIMSELEKEQFDELDWGAYVSIENGDEVDC